ncbi:MerC domain-containing protein [Deminuibacter soli]|uniref:MerC domain-containing protein n=1 Tax=Deminuibacter soli TaxID=2291815 RepID=A0A3E1NQP8_9BACT|nr:MerC domain-containing protein [Deminuibacter soli]RFM30227.1 MerC domain-containing protein [Deminuibacter soli]
MNWKINWDAMGITASLVCAIHCALLPLILSSLPIFGINIIDNAWFEYGMIALALVIGAYSFRHGFTKHHHRLLPVMLFAAGFALLFCKQVWHSYQFWFLPPAVVLIVSAHYINYRFCRKADHCHADDCAHGSTTAHKHEAHSNTKAA